MPYVVLSVLDTVMLVATVSGSLFSMLQDRKRPVWPVVPAMIPFAALGVLHVIYPEGPALTLAISYFLLFSLYLIIYGDFNQAI